MRIVGITGGIGSGKSQVLSHLELEYRAKVRQLDAVARELQKQGTVCYQEIVHAFGCDILLNNGDLDRQKMAAIIFSSPRKRQLLNAIVHPHVKEWIRHDIFLEKKQNTFLYAIEAALLIEDNYREICDEIWYIFTEKSVRMIRLEESRMYTKDKILQIMDSQLSEKKFRENADVVIDNTGDFKDTKQQVNAIVDSYAQRIIFH